MEFGNPDFTRLVKRTREKFGISIDGAHELIFADEEMRRLVALRINCDEDCRRQALWDLRQKGEKSRFVQIGGRVRFRDASSRS